MEEAVEACVSGLVKGLVGGCEFGCLSGERITWSLCVVGKWVGSGCKTKRNIER